MANNKPAISAGHRAIMARIPCRVCGMPIGMPCVSTVTAKVLRYGHRTLAMDFSDKDDIDRTRRLAEAFFLSGVDV